MIPTSSINATRFGRQYDWYRVHIRTAEWGLVNDVAFTRFRFIEILLYDNGHFTPIVLVTAAHGTSYGHVRTN